MREKMICAGTTHAGLVREKNEDRYAIIDGGQIPPVLIVADGMGGHRKGELASQIAVDSMIKHLDQLCGQAIDDNILMEQIVEAIEKTNIEIYLRSCEDEANRGMGTTLTVAVFRQENLLLAHAGDCRAYLLRDGALVQLTEDHTLVQEMVAAGSLSPDETANHPRRNVLTRALGVPEYIQPDHLILPREKGDRIILCSDGLYGAVSDKIIETEMRKEKEPSALVSSLVEKALNCGGADNITVLAAYS